MPPPCHDASDSNPVHIKLADYGMYGDHVLYLFPIYERCGFKCSEMCCVVGWAVPVISLKWWKPFIQWHSSTSLKTWILTIDTVRTSNLAMTDMPLVSVSYFCIIGISRLTLPSGTKGFGGTEGFMAPEIMRYNGEEEYTEKVKLKFCLVHYIVVQLPVMLSVRIVMYGQLNVIV